MPAAFFDRGTGRVCKKYTHPVHAFMMTGSHNKYAAHTHTYINFACTRCAQNTSNIYAISIARMSEQFSSVYAHSTAMSACTCVFTQECVVPGGNIYICSADCVCSLAAYIMMCFLHVAARDTASVWTRARASHIAVRCEPSSNTHTGTLLHGTTMHSNTHTHSLARHTRDVY